MSTATPPHRCRLVMVQIGDLRGSPRSVNAARPSDSEKCAVCRFRTHTFESSSRLCLTKRGGKVPIRLYWLDGLSCGLDWVVTIVTLFLVADCPVFKIGAKNDAPVPLKVVSV